MRELQAVLRLPRHPNVVQLYEVHREFNGLVSFVLEYMPTGSLLDMMDSRVKKKLGPIPDTQVRCLVRQLLSGVQHLHQHGIIHRDLKPENILLAGSVCKVADFSLACQHDEEGQPTTYISTRWYRAPEILLASKKYSSSVDIWAVGCIAVELYQLEPLFPGSDEIDQLRLIFTGLGTPNMVGWKEGSALLNAINVGSWHDSTQALVDSRTFLQDLLSRNSTEDNRIDAMAVDFLLKMLLVDPTERIDAKHALDHKFFKGVATIARVDSVTPQQHGNSSRYYPTTRQAEHMQHNSLASRPPTAPMNSRTMPVTNFVTVSPLPGEENSITSHAAMMRKQKEPFKSSSLSFNPYACAKQRKQRIS
jgi:male germ cell-associated kinase